MKIYKLALSKYADYALIFEDDFILQKHTMNETINNALKCINKYPNFYKICLYNSGIIQSKKTLINGIFIAQFLFTRCYIISKVAMQDTLAKKISNNHIDLKQLFEWWDKQTFCIYPPLVHDRPAQSTNNYDYKFNIINFIIKSPYFFIIEYYFFKACEYISLIRNIFLFFAKKQYFKYENKNL